MPQRTTRPPPPYVTLEGPDRDVHVAERLWADAEEARVRAEAALAHALGVQRLCDRVLAPEPWPVLAADEWATVVLPAVTEAIASLGTALVAVLGGPGPGRTALAKALLAALPPGSTLHDDDRPVPGPLVFAEDAATVVARQRDSILHTGQAVLVAFTGSLHPPLAAAYRHHLVPGEDGPCRRLHLMLDHAGRDGYALLTVLTRAGRVKRRLPLGQAPPGLAAGPLRSTSRAGAPTAAAGCQGGTISNAHTRPSLS